MPLFDDFLRVEMRPRRQNEGGFEYSNTSARPGICAIRDLLEGWFERIPPAARWDIRGRFRSCDEAQHQSAFFEMYWHQLLRCCGYEVEIHPEMPDVAASPDFLARSNGIRRFYLEATLAMPPGDPAADRRFAEFHDMLDRMDSPDYFLEVEMLGRPQGNIRGRVLRSKLQRWFCALDYAEISRLYREQAYNEVPTLTLSEQGCDLTFTPIPKGPQFRGQPGARSVGVVMPAEMRVLRTDNDIRAAIDGKATKYGNSEHPLIIAVNVLDDFCDDDDIWNALFGDEQLVLIPQLDGSFRHDQTRRAPNGAWRGRGGPRNTRVSAVCITSQLLPSTLRSQSVVLIHNPWAMNPLRLNALPIPQITFSVGDGQIRSHGGRHHADLVGVPDSWPC